MFYGLRFHATHDSKHVQWSTVVAHTLFSTHGEFVWLHPHGRVGIAVDVCGRMALDVSVSIERMKNLKLAPWHRQDRHIKFKSSSGGQKCTRQCWRKLRCNCTMIHSRWSFAAVKRRWMGMDRANMGGVTPGRLRSASVSSRSCNSYLTSWRSWITRSICKSGARYTWMDDMRGTGTNAIVSEHKRVCQNVRWGNESRQRSENGNVTGCGWAGFCCCKIFTTHFGPKLQCDKFCSTCQNQNHESTCFTKHSWNPDNNETSLREVHLMICAFMQLMIRNMCNGQRWSHTHYFPPTGKSSGCILPTSHSGRRQTKRVQHNFDQNLKVQTDQTCHHVTDRPPHWLLMANAHTSTLILHYTPIQGPDGISSHQLHFHTSQTQANWAQHCCRWKRLSGHWPWFLLLEVWFCQLAPQGLPVRR